MSEKTRLAVSHNVAPGNEVRDVPTPIQALLREGSEHAMPEAENTFEHYGQAIQGCIAEISDLATANPDDYPVAPKKDGSELGIGADMLRSLAITASNNKTNGPGTGNKPGRLTPLDANTVPATFANLGRRIITKYPTPALLTTELEKQFAEKREIATQLGVTDFREPEQMMRVVDKLLPVLYGERYTAHIHAVQAANAREQAATTAKETEAAEARQASLEEQQAAFAAGEVLTNRSATKIAIHASAAKRMNSLQRTATHGQNLLITPYVTVIRHRQARAKKHWEKRQRKADSALFLHKWHAKRVAKAKGAYDKQSTRLTKVTGKQAARVASAENNAVAREKAHDSYQAQANEKALASLKKDQALMRKHQRTVDHRYMQSNVFRNLPESERAAAVVQFHDSPAYARAIRALLVEDLRKKAKNEGTYKPPRAPAQSG